MNPVSGKRQEPVLRLRAGQRPQSFMEWKDVGEELSAHGHLLPQLAHPSPGHTVLPSLPGHSTLPSHLFVTR